MNSRFGIVLGRWTGIFYPIWYADVVHQADERPYTTFNALTKRGALRKATRYIRKRLHVLEEADAIVYSYDENTFSLERVDVG